MLISEIVQVEAAKISGTESVDVNTGSQTRMGTSSGVGTLFRKRWNQKEQVTLNQTHQPTNGQRLDCLKKKFEKWKFRQVESTDKSSAQSSLKHITTQKDT